MNDKEKLNKEKANEVQQPLAPKQQQEEELSLDELEAVSGSAASPKPKERGSSRRNVGI